MTHVLTPDANMQCVVLPYLLVTRNKEQTVQRMDKSHTTKRILELNLEIIYLLTGEDCAVMKKTSGEQDTLNTSSHLSEAWRRIQRPIAVSSLDILGPEQVKKILDATQKIIDLLTGEVPIRCQDVTVYFSMEEWEYLEGHKDLYKDVMTEDHQILNYVKLEKKKTHLNYITLNLTMEILYLLTGENYEVVKSVSGEQITRSCPNGSSHFVTSETYNKQQWRRSSLLHESPITVPPPHCLITKITVEKILEVTKKIIELLTGEVPIRCEDVTVYFSMEEWEYLEGHKDLYKDVKMEDQPMSTLLDGYNVHNTSEGPVNLSSDRSSEDLQQYSTNIHSRLRPRSMNSSDPDKTSHHAHSFLSEDHPSFHSESKDPSDSEESCPGTTPTVKHRRKKIFRCSECDKCYTRKAHVLRHQALHTGLLPYTCSECGKSYAQKAELSDHLRVHTGERPFSCPVCGQGYKQKRNLNSHLTVHSGEKPFSCSECGKCFKWKPSLTLHLQNHTSTRQHTCTECGKGFTRKSVLVKHQLTHTDERPFCCTVCGKLFKEKRSLDQHWKLHINDFSCSVCKLMFESRRELYKHCGEHRTHRRERVFSCSECEKRFEIKSQLLNHLRVHTGEKPFSCPECEKCFKDKGSLRFHLKLHSAEKTFSCSECGKKFKTNEYLVRHQRIHTGEPTYTCSECGKAFRSKSYFFQHQRLHTGETFACSDCEKVFITKSLLAQHQRIHTGEKP